MVLDAEKFLKRAVSDEAFRKSLYLYETDKEKLDFIASEGFNFHPDEVEDAVNHLKVESPTEDNAILVEEIFMWWGMLLEGDYPPMEKPSSSPKGGCAPSACASCHSSSCH